jgi:hypothetical protein
MALSIPMPMQLPQHLLLLERRLIQ